MRKFVGLPSASVLFEGLSNASVHPDLSWWLLRLQSWKINTIHWNWDWLVLTFASVFGTVGCSNWVIDLFIDTKLTRKSFRLWFLLWHSPHVWVFVESVILLESSTSCFCSLYTMRDFFCERLVGSSASKSIRLVGSRVRSQLGSFFCLLIYSSNWMKWFPRTWFLAIGLRHVDAFACLAKRKIANSTKNLERAGIASILFFQCFNGFFKCSQCLICLCNLAKTWVW